VAGFAAQIDVEFFFWINADKCLITFLVGHSRQHQTLKQGLAADEKILGIEYRLVHKTAAQGHFLVKDRAQINERTGDGRDDQTAGK